MLSQKSFIINCPSHTENKIGFVCIKPNCKNRLICSKCSKSHEAGHDNFYVSIVELFTTNVEKHCQDALEKTQETVNKSIQAMRDIDVHLDNLKNDLIDAVEEIRASIKSNLMLVEPDDLLKQLFKAKNNFLAELDMDMSSIITNLAQISESFTEFKDIERNILGLKPPASYEYDSKTYEENVKIVKKMLKRINVGPSSTSFHAWNFSSNRMCRYLRPNYDTRHIYRDNYLGALAAAGDFLMKNGSYSWYFEVQHTHSEEETLGIAIGLMPKRIADSISNWDNELKSKDVITVSTTRAVCNMNLLDNYEPDGVYCCTVDFDSKIFEVSKRDKMIAQGNLKEGDEYYPVIIFNRKGKATLKFEL